MTQTDYIADAEALYASRIERGYVFSMPSAWRTYDGEGYCIVLPLVRTAHAVQSLDCLVYDKATGRIVQEGNTPWE